MQFKTALACLMLVPALAFAATHKPTPIEKATQELAVDINQGYQEAVANKAADASLFTLTAQADKSTLRVQMRFLDEADLASQANETREKFSEFICTQNPDLIQAGMSIAMQIEDPLNIIQFTVNSMSCQSYWKPKKAQTHAKRK